MKSQDQQILTALLDDVEQHLPVKLSRDKNRVNARVQAEGLEFLSKTLPTLDDLLLKGLSSGTLPVIPGWKYGNGHPVFLGPLWGRVFDKDGRLKSTPCKLSILFLRQITRMYKKQFLVCEDRYVEEAIDKFIATDGEVLTDLPPEVSSLRAQLRILFPWLFRPLEGVEFKHGPGAVAEKVDSVSKWDFPTVPIGFYDLFDGIVVRQHHSDFISDPPLEVDSPARLVAVPKTATKPRLISIEPVTTQYLQQGIHSSLKRNLSRDWRTNYSVQEPNQELARIGSIESNWATIDLSEASDRVSWSLVSELFKGTALSPYLHVLRTRTVSIDGRGELPLRKFASMGSALTFPIQIMVFACIAAEAITRSGEKVGRRSFRVYGDDIIVPNHTAGLTMELLEYFGLKVNTSKSFDTGKFRESCGADWYDGLNVTPVYSRKPAVSRPTSDGAASLVSLRNQLYERHLYPSAVAVIDKMIADWRVSTHDCANGCTDGTLHGREDTYWTWNRAMQRRMYRSISQKEIRECIAPSDAAKLRFALNRIGSEPSSYDPLMWQSRPRRLKSRIGRQPEGW